MERGIKLFFAAILSIVCLSPAYPQKHDIKFEHLNIGEGLSQSVVTSITQDKLGYLWIGTHDGLNRFDGYSFRYYKQDMNDSTSLSDNRIRSLFVDKKGVLWIGTEDGGLNRYNRDKKNFTTYQHNPEKDLFFPYNMVNCITGDNMGNLWLGTLKTMIIKFNKNEGTSKVIKLPQNITQSWKRGPQEINDIVIDKNGNLWIASFGQGLYCYDPRDEKVIKHLYNSQETGNILPTNEINNLLLDKNNRLWIGTTYGLSILNPETGKIIQKNQLPDYKDYYEVRGLYQDNLGNIWIGFLNNGLAKFNNETGNYSFYRHDPSIENSLSINNLLEIYGDRTGVIWVGTNGGGIDRFIAHPKFNFYSNNAGLDTFFAKKSVRSIYEDSNHLWVGGYNGLTRIHRGKNKIQHYAETKAPYSLPNINVYCLLEDSKNRFWVGTEGGGFCRMDRETGKFYQYSFQRKDTKGLSSPFIYDFYEGKSGDLWLATGNGLNRFDPEKETFQNYLTGLNNRFSRSIHQIVKDSFNRLWLATETGSSCFALSQGIIRLSVANPAIPIILATTGSIVSISPDPGWPGLLLPEED